MELFWEYVKRLKIKEVNKETFLRFFKTHPEHMSFLSMTDFLKTINVENVVIKSNVEELIELPKPQLFQMVDDKTNDFGIITNSTPETVEYFYNNKTYKEPLYSFKHKWNGILLLAEKNKHSKELSFDANRKKYLRDKIRKPALIISMLFMFLITLLNVKDKLFVSSHTYWLILILKTFGVFVSSILMYKSFFGGNNKLIDKICKVKGRSGCDSVLNSASAKIFGWLSWAEIGFVYFTGCVLCLLIVEENNILPFLSLFAAGSLIYVFYSLYFQFYVLKKLCTLCLIIQCIFLTEGILLLPLLVDLKMSLIVFLNIGACYTIPIFIWLFVKPYIESSFKVQNLERQIFNYKIDKAIFHHKLSQQPKIENLNNIGQSLVYEKDISNELLIVSSPFCNPCSNIHLRVEKLKEHFRGKLNVSVVYAVSENEDDDNYKAALYLLNVNEKYDSERASRISKEWYKAGRKNINYFNKYQQNKVSKEVEDGLLKQINWCEANNILYTPSIFYNGRLFPKEQELEDLLFYI